ncbi:MAG: hypothetical protein CH6_1073 [Candidatus Kapaibacterium sp.]|nr:MAG: hypothetical protein CH6_1073 [Candidatus Kapabacteria bacterium]
MVMGRNYEYRLEPTYKELKLEIRRICWDYHQEIRAYL